MSKDTFYIVSFDLQRDEISTLCFDQCGSINIGAIEIELDPGLPPMLFLPCSRANCPYLDRQLDEPTVSSDQGVFFLRKLKSLNNLITPAPLNRQKAG